MVLSAIKKHILILGYLTKFRIMLNAEYRFGFLIEMAVEVGYQIIGILFFSIIYSNIQQIGGWNFYEVMFLYGLNIVIVATLIGFAFVFNLRLLPENIKNGNIDIALVKPINETFQLTFAYPYISSIMSTATGFFLIAYSLNALQLSLNVLDILFLIVLSISGFIIGYSIITMITSLSFLFSNAKVLPRLGLSTLTSFSDLPHTIYSGALKGLFFFALPVVFVSSVPADALLHGYRLDYAVVSVITAFVFFALTIKVWHLMIRNYSSASS